METSMPSKNGASGLKVPMRFEINHAVSNLDLATTTSLFTDYTNALNADLSFQNLATELATMPGKYGSSQGGALLLARDIETGEPLGCVGLRALPNANTPGHVNEGCCEMKRLYVTPAGRGRGVGKMLAARTVEEARSLGYSEIMLDTWPNMSEALGIYDKLGFLRCRAYYETPVKETVFLSKKLGTNEA